MQKIAQFIFKLIGWKIVGSLPDEKKYILIVAPHTSNWDTVIGLIARFIIGVKIHFLAKHQLFFFPLGQLLKALGAIPVNRSIKGNVVEQTAQMFRSQEALRLAITPEGTRGPVARWKEGFYHMASQAGVPIVMVGLDYASKEVRLESPFVPSGDMAADFDKIFSFFKTIKGCYPKIIPDKQS